MPPTWEAERIADIDLARRLIAAQFRDLAVETLEPLGSGWDNTAYLLNKSIVFRFPRRQIAVPFIDMECAVLPRLSRRLPVPIPIPEWVGEPTEDFPWPFAGYRYISGITACHAEMSDKERQDMAEPLAVILRQLHDIPLDEARSWGLKGDVIGKLDMVRVRERSVDYLNNIVSSEFAEFIDVIESAYSACDQLIPAAEATIVHGDFYVRHLIVNPQRKLSGVIDWGDMHLGDPAVDLSIAHSFLPPAAHAAFRQAYGSISAKEWKFARMRAAFYGLALANYAKAVGDNKLAKEAYKSLSFVSQGDVN